MAIATIQVTRMKNGHSFELMRGDRRGNTTAPNRSTAYDLVKIENRSRKRSHKLDGVGVGRIRTFSFLPIPFAAPSLMIQ